MSASRRWKLAWVGILALAGAGATPAHAEPDAGADAERRAKVAIRIGAATVTVGELEDRLAAIPPFQLRTLGDSREAIVKRVIEETIVRERLLAEGAKARGLDREEPWMHQLARARSSATLRALQKGLPAPAAIPMEDVMRFYEENRSRFDSPERVNLWRILVASNDKAESVLAEARREPTIAKYNELAREHSIDKATNLRGGNLGFLAADGTSNEAGLKVEPALVEAARAVKDGELVPRPVPEGEGFAVVWRRATVPATKRPVEEAAAQIRTTLHRERTEAAEKRLMTELREKHLSDVSYDRLKIIELGSADGGLTIPRSTPTAKPPAPGSGSGR